MYNLGDHFKIDKKRAKANDKNIIKGERNRYHGYLGEYRRIY